MNVTEHVIKLECTKGAYSYVVMDGSNGVTLIDTSMPKMGVKIMKELETYGIQSRDIKRILLTHHDIDHIGNVAYFQKLSGCELWISELDYPQAMGLAKRHGIKNIFGKFMKAEAPNNMSCFNTNRMDGFDILLTPGHTPGHTCFRYENVMFSGDLMRSRDGKLKLSPNIMNWDKEKLIESISRLPIEGVEWLCPAHGEPLQVKGAWSMFLSDLNANGR